VVSKDVFVVSHSFAKPNPFQNEVSFCFQHNLAGKNMKAYVTISDLSGRKFAEFEQQLENTNFTEDRVVWNGRSAGFSEINAGLYLFRVDLVSEDGRKTAFYGKVMKN